MNITIIRGAGFSSNCFLLQEENNSKIVIVDLGLPGEQTSFKLREALLSLTEKNFDIELEVFLSHCHVDHILGFDNLEGFSNITFSSSPKTTQHINARDRVTLLGMFGGGSIGYEVTKIYEHEEKLVLGSEDLMVLHTPGHTDGCAVLYDQEAKALFAGDVVFAGGASGRVDLPTGDRQTLIQSLNALAKLEIQHLYSGHGQEVHKNVNENILAAKRMLEKSYY